MKLNSQRLLKMPHCFLLLFASRLIPVGVSSFCLSVRYRYRCVKGSGCARLSFRRRLLLEGSGCGDESKQKM